MSERAIIIIFGMIVLSLALLFYVLTLPRMDNYNAHVCAVNGYEPDCQTPLQKEE